MKIKFNSNFLMIAVILYLLFVPRTIKLLYSPKVNGLNSTNDIYIVCFFVLLLLLLSIILNIKYYNSIIISKFSLICIIFIGYIIFNTIFNTHFNEQNRYAMIVTAIPIFLLFLPKFLFKYDDKWFLRISSLISIIYSLLALYNSTHSSISIGNAYFISSNQARVSLPIGSPTTVVFYFLASLPLVNLSISKDNNRVLSSIYKFGFWLIIFASFLTLSRAGVAVVLIIAGWSLYNRSKKTKITKRLLGVTVIIAVVLFATSFIASKFNFSRLIMGFTDSSVSERLKGIVLFFEIFKHNPLFGTGCGEFFTRVYTSNVWSDRIISAYGKSGVLDPHNGYILMMSENGIIGIIFLIIIILIIFKKFISIDDLENKSAALQLLVGVTAYSFTSSDLFNVIGIATVIYLYFSYFLYATN